MEQRDRVPSGLPGFAAGAFLKATVSPLRGRETDRLTAARIIDELRKCGVTHVIYLPDSQSRSLPEAIQGEGSLMLVPVCREGEAIAIAAGLILGGKEPVVMHQSTGLFESGDSIRALAVDLGLPLLMLIDYRGWRRTAPARDSAAVFLEPVLRSWGVGYHLVTRTQDLGLIAQGFAEAQERKAPVAILLASTGESR
jgi:sulfopyruvate decarboxylase TPP-binding subunit